MANRLAAEASPYLRQHAANPVDWYPWGDAAFAAAAAEDRPVLLSVGYSACHWCHVMAHESFEDRRIAEAINALCVPVKVDREEHPDIDALYQGICQAVTGQGGWPLTVFLTPDLRPFYVGTYFPPTARYGRPGLEDLLRAVGRAWREDRPRVLEVANDWTAVLDRLQSAAPPGGGGGAAPGREVLVAAAEALRAEVDPIHGGFGDAPKFPHTEALEVLLRAGGAGSAAALGTLRAMAAGGIRDHLGGGFHRYSVDGAWAVPHFEKMLYDNALLAPVYLAAHQCTGDVELAAVAREILDYLLTDLAAPGGAFYSTEDADSAAASGQPAEGAFYTWTPEEVLAATGSAARAERACAHFGVTEAGNFEGGRSVLRLGAWQLPEAEAAEIRASMREHRARRPRPARDEKVLAGWNGLAISAFARAGRILGEPRYIAAACAAAEFVCGALGTPGGGLLRRHPREPGPIAGTLEDYACVAVGLIDLYEATLEARWLAHAVRLAEQAIDRFWDASASAFYLSEGGRADLVRRPRDDGDAGTPSAQSMAVQALIRLRPFVGDARFAAIPAAVLDRCAPLMARHPRGVASLLCALDRALDPLEIILAVPGGRQPPEEWLRQLRARYLPNLVLSSVGAQVPGLASVPPVWEGRGPTGALPTLWVCRGQTCAPPAHDWREIAHLLP